MAFGFRLRSSSNEDFTSPRSASRIISSTWPWNSPAMRRSFFTVSLTARMATGMSFGPMAISATTPIRAISEKAKSNIAVS